MSHFALTDIGNPNLKVRKRTLQTFKDKHRELRTTLETYFNGYEIDIQTNSLGKLKCEEPIYSEFQVKNTANVRIGTSTETLKSMFNKHLNMEKDDNKIKDNLTESHRNFFYNLTNRIISCLLSSDANIERINYEPDRLYHVHLILELIINQKIHRLFISLEVHESNPDYTFHKELSKQEIQSTVESVPIQLDATLLCKKYSLADAKKMKVGDVIFLDKKDTITLKVNNKPIFLGKLIVDEHNQLGVKYE